MISEQVAMACRTDIVLERLALSGAARGQAVILPSYDPETSHAQGSQCAHTGWPGTGRSEVAGNVEIRAQCPAALYRRASRSPLVGDGRLCC